MERGGENLMGGGGIAPYMYIDFWVPYLQVAYFLQASVHVKILTMFVFHRVLTKYWRHFQTVTPKINIHIGCYYILVLTNFHMLSYVLERHKEKGQIKGLIRYGIGVEGKSEWVYYNKNY
ncbi:MAG: hypothetical protein K0R15_1276 [Clostridiales bacterium]|nr:hypothetical protein [Clostridiales bacterium]